MRQPLPILLTAAIPPLATTDAVLNAVATVLLLTGFVLIKQGRETAHKWTMLGCFGGHAEPLVRPPPGHREAPRGPG